MRPAAALVYLASVARVAAIQYGFPSVKSETSSFIDVNPVSVADGSLGQFEKKLKFANLTSDLEPHAPRRCQGSCRPRALQCGIWQLSVPHTCTGRRGAAD